MSLWKVKFNHKDGEVRKCKLCDADFYTMKPIWRCKKCVAKVNFDTAKNKYGEGLMPTGKWAGMPMKKPYPFSTTTNQAGRRFQKIRTTLSKAWKEYQKTGDKSVITKHYAKQLEEIRQNGILEWILDRRGSDDTINNLPKLKSKKQTNVDWPDTRGYYEY